MVRMLLLLALLGFQPAAAQTSGVDFYVAPGGSDAMDCASPAEACAHVSFVSAKAATFGPQIGGVQRIHIAAGGYNEGINFNANTNTVWLIGAGHGYTFLNNLPGGCGTIIANTGANIALTDMTISAVADPCSNTVYAQLGGVINIGPDVRLGPTYGAQFHCEGPGSQIQIWYGVTVIGSANNFAAATSSCQVGFNPLLGIGVTFSPAQSYPGGVLFAMVNGSIYIPANMTWSGLVNGPSYVASTNATIWTDGKGCGSLPGSMTGSSSTGGVCQ